MRKPSIACLLAMLLVSLCVKAMTFGTWTYYHAYTNLTHVVPVGNQVFALSEGLLYSYNVKEDSYTEYDYSNYLSDYNSITDICYNQTTKRLVICYNNGNIDLLSVSNGNVENISAIYKETTSRDKTIKACHCNGKYAYITMPYGVVIINTERAEISNTYRIAEVENTITGTYVSGDSIYVVSSEKLSDYGSTVIAGSLKTNLLDDNNWKACSSETATDVTAKINTTQQQRSIYLVGNTAKKNPDLVSDTYNKCYWGSNADNILTRYEKQDGSYVESGSAKKPYGPSSNNIFNLKFKHNNLYCISMGMQTMLTSKYKPNTGVIQVLNTSNDKWNTFETPSKDIIKHNYTNSSNLTIDPRDTAHVMVGSNEGVYEFLSGKFIKHYDKSNSPIKSLQDGNSATYQMVLGLEYDKSGRLWVLNTFCSNGILSLDQSSPRDTTTANNVWKNYTDHPEINVFKPYERYLTHPFFDSKGKLWFINAHYYEGAFYRYNTDTDELKQYVPRTNQDGGTVYDDQGTGWIRHINEDQQGNIWIAGTKGIAYIPADKQETLSNEVYLHKVNRNDGSNFADYLLYNIDATCILFDKANRMFVSTMGNGIYVISADHNEEIAHYTTSNSNIMSDVVYFLALDDKTGTLYASTSNGLCSVTTDAREVPQSLSKDNIKVYPNPVTPDYTGPITIDGLTIGADIKITTASGAIVHRGRADAVLYQWDGCDLEGNRCASGVYNILLATSEGESGCVGKIAIVK